MCYSNNNCGGAWGDYWWIILIFAVILIWCCSCQNDGYNSCGCGCEEQHCC